MESRLLLGVWVPLPGVLLFTDHDLLQSFASGNRIAEKTHAILAYIPQLQAAEWRREPKQGVALRELVMKALEQVHVGVFAALPGFVLWMSGTVIFKTRVR